MVLLVFKLLHILRNSSVWPKDSVEQHGGEAVVETANTLLTPDVAIHSRSSSLAWQVRRHYVGKGGLWPQFPMTGTDVCFRREEHIAEGKQREKLCSSGRFRWVWEDRLVEENSRIQMK